MELKILQYPNPFLKQRCEEIKEITPEISRLAFDMIETMEKSKGVGLAAPQVGELKRMIVVQLVSDRAEKNKTPQIFINPVIVKKGRETAIEEEGCLSLPEKFFKIKRTKSIEVEALNWKGEKVKVSAEGLLSRVLQHEIDHLDGVLFIDRIGFWEKLKLKRKLKNVN